jgi:two-component system, chemotaxis family, chemotaxis protein CheY
MAGELIMVVDDDESIRSALSELLSDEGYRVITVPGGSEALACLSDGQRPDAILLDLMMPQMDGWKFRAEQMVNPALAAIPVIVITAVTHPEPTATLGVATFKKPLDTGALLAAIRKHCTHAGRTIAPEQSAPSLAPTE